MNIYVDKYIKKNNKILVENKAAFLDSIGIHDREYAPSEDSVGTDYPHLDKETNKHYKTVPATLTEEEYEEVLKSYKAVKKAENQKNSSSYVLKLCAFLIWLGGFCIVGVLSNDEKKSDSSLIITYIIIAFVCGMFFWALGEIIRLLNEINNKD
ncbi:MAG: hypothetical protein J6O40_01575 [Ruminococcus sp.]|nr:hypothetical protein [Ruminococcus sp.]